MLMKGRTTMTTDNFPLIDCSNIQRYFEMAGIPVVNIPKFRGNLNHVEGVCNGDVKFKIAFAGDDKVKVQAGSIIKFINTTDL